MVKDIMAKVIHHNARTTKQIGSQWPLTLPIHANEINHVNDEFQTLDKVISASN
jgi:hypothetical protein